MSPRLQVFPLGVSNVARPMAERYRLLADWGNGGPGTWAVSQVGVSITCPKCKTRAYLDDHTVHDDGNVEPSIVCGACGWHEYAVLVGWRT